MRVAVTGHRPDKLGGYSEEVFWGLVQFADLILTNIPDTKVVISGMALGWDQAIAAAAIKRDIPLIAAVPFINQESRWSIKDKKRYKILLKKSKVQIICEGGYAPWKMQKRNEWMVDHCDLLIALWNGSAGGTANCVRYAKKVGKKVFNVWEKFGQQA